MVMSKQDIKPLPDNPMYRAMRSGHLKRTGHELDAFLRPTATWGGETVYKVVRKCCTTTEEEVL